MGKETWKDIPFIHGYQISDCGNLRSFRAGNGYTGQCWNSIPHPITPGRYTARRNKLGYMCINYRILLPDGHYKHKTMSLHKAVMLTFVGPCPDGLEIRHLNGDISDNHLANLAYGTHQENMADKKIHGTELIGSKSFSAKLIENDVLIIRQRYAKGGITQQQLATEYGLSSTAMGELLLGHHWAHVEKINPEQELYYTEQPRGDVTELTRNGIEIWVDIPDCYGYQVSNLGRIRSKWAKGVRPRVLGPRWWIMKLIDTRNRNGEIITRGVHICPEGEKPFNSPVRTIVARVFIGDSQGKESFHIDGDKSNCRLDNITYGTRYEIMRAAATRGAYSIPKILTAEKVLEIRRRGANGEIQRKLAEEFCVCPATISNIIKRKIWRHI